jgi:hypothetical protein
VDEHARAGAVGDRVAEQAVELTADEVRADEPGVAHLVVADDSAVGLEQPDAGEVADHPHVGDDVAVGVREADAVGAQPAHLVTHRPRA